MPAGNTYEAIFTETLASAQASVTFSSIPSTYTDLVLVVTAKSSSTDTVVVAQFNSDTSNSGTNYSYTRIYGNGTSALSDRASNNAWIPVGRLTTSSDSHFGQGIAHLMNYANATTYKTVLTRGDNASSMTNASVGLWRATPAAISTIVISVANGASNLAAGSTFSLYGIKAA